MGKTYKTETEKEAIVADYLLGGKTIRKLGEEYGIDFRTIHHWVQKFRGKRPMKKKSKQEPTLPDSDQPCDVKKLQEALRKANLHVELLNTMIDIAEKDLKIDIRKKSGTKR